MKEKVLNALPGSKVDDELVVETTFGVDGEIASSPVRKTDPKVSYDFELKTHYRGYSWLEIQIKS